MNKHWELLCVACTHDLEDKLSLSPVEPLHDQVLALCQLELRESASYHPPRSTAVQAQICRFAQEALQAQFHLIRATGQIFNKTTLEKALKTASQLLDFFLKSHNWHAQVHAAIIIPPYLIQDCEPEELGKLVILCIGSPHIYTHTKDSVEIKSLLPVTSHPRRGFGELYPFTFETLYLYVPSSQRFLIGMPSWQQVRPTLMLRLFEENWTKLTHLLLGMINNPEIDPHPFYFVQVIGPGGQWQRHLTKGWQRFCAPFTRLFKKKRSL